MPAMKTRPAPPTQEQQLKVREKATRWAKERLSDPNTLIIDVETTGMLKNDPETGVVSIAMINPKGQVVLAALVDPERPIPMEVTKIHGIESRDVKGCPPWYVIGDMVSALMRGKHVVAFNAGFDIHLIVNLFQRYEMEVPDFEVSCAMEHYAEFVGEWSKSKSDYKWQRLPKLAYGTAHDSLVDCQSTLLLLKKMAGDFSDEPQTDTISLDF